MERIILKLAEIQQLLSKQNLLQKEILTLQDACDYLNASASYLYKLTCTNQIPHYIPTGKKIYFKRKELDEWLLRNRQSSTSEIQQQAANYLIKKGKKGG